MSEIGSIRIFEDYQYQLDNSFILGVGSSLDPIVVECGGEVMPDSASLG